MVYNVLFTDGNTEGACLLNKLYCENIPEQVCCNQYSKALWDMSTL